MQNKINYNDKNFQNVTVSVMNDILKSDANGSNMDDVYKTVCKYANLTRNQFEENYKQAEAQLNEWKNEGYLSGEKCELNEDALDMVVGGGIGSFFSAIGNGIADAACAVGNFVKENAALIGVVVATVAICAIAGGALGAMIGYIVAGSISVGGSAAIGATVGGVLGLASDILIENLDN